MKIQFHRIDTNVVVGLLVREFCCSGTDVSAKVLAMYAGTRTPSMEPQWLAAGLSQDKSFIRLPRHSSFMIMHIFVDWGNTGHNMAESLGITTVSTTKAHERNRDKCKRVGRNP